MKTLLLSLLLLFPLLVSAQDSITDQGGATYKVKILKETDEKITVRLESGDERTYDKKWLTKIYKHEVYKDPLPINSETGKIEFQNVITIDGKSKDELYLASREWFAKTFTSSNAVLQLDDKEAGKLIGKGFADHYVKLTPNAYTSMKYRMYFTLSVDIKDNKYRYTISDITFKDDTFSSMNGPAELITSDSKLYKSNGKPNTYHTGAKTAIIEYFPVMAESLNAYLLAYKTDNW